MRFRITGIDVFDWDDLRFFLAVERHGSTLAAGAALGASQSTVFRRIAALEKTLGVALFDRRPSGYGLTPSGHDLLPLAREVEAAAQALAHAASGEARRQLTVIRFSAPDAALEYMLPTVMAGFRERYPEVRLEILVSPKQLDLAGGEADVALRANPASDADLFGRRLVDEQPTLCASREYAARHGLPATDAEVAEHDFIAPAGVLAAVLADWVAAHVPPARIMLTPDGVPSTLTAVRSHVGLAVLPQFIVDREPSLQAAPLRLPIEPFELWILTHRRLRRSAPVLALMDLVADYVLATTPPR